MQSLIALLLFFLFAACAIGGVRDDSFTIPAPISVDFDDLAEEAVLDIDDSDEDEEPDWVDFHEVVGPPEKDLQPTWEEYDGD
jgi:hypothetical protein